MSESSMQIKFGSHTLNAVGHSEKPTFKNSVLKGVKAWLGLWAVAIVCVPVPVLHLVITPLALLFGPIIGLLVFYRSRRLIAHLEVSGECPECKSPFTAEFRDTLPPLYGMCPSCKAGYEVVLPQKK